MAKTEAATNQGFEAVLNDIFAISGSDESWAMLVQRTYSETDDQDR